MVATFSVTFTCAASSIGVASFGSPPTTAISKNEISRPGLRLNMQRLDQLENQRVGVVDLLQEIDRRPHRPVVADLEGKALAVADRKDICDMAIGDHDGVGDQPSGADPIELPALQFDTADRTRMARSRAGLAC